MFINFKSIENFRRERDRERVLDGSNPRKVPKQGNVTKLVKDAFMRRTSKFKKFLKWRKSRV